MTAAPPIEAILWDNDGVLVDTERLYFDACRQVALTAEFDLTIELFREYFLRQATGIWHLLEEKGYSAAEVEQLRETRNGIYERLLTTASFGIDGVAETLAQLKPKYPMAIVTSCHPHHFATMHRNTGLLEYFQFTLTREQYGESKPHPEPYLTAARKLGIAPENCLVIEDSERGLTAAVAAGMRCWIVPSELSAGGDFSAAERRLTAVEEIAELL